MKYRDLYVYTVYINTLLYYNINIKYIVNIIYIVINKLIFSYFWRIDGQYELRWRLRRANASVFVGCREVQRCVEFAGAVALDLAVRTTQTVFVIQKTHRVFCVFCRFLVFCSKIIQKLFLFFDLFEFFFCLFKNSHERNTWLFNTCVGLFHIKLSCFFRFCWTAF